MADGTGSDGMEPPRSSFAESRRFVPRAFVQPVLSFMRTEASGGIIMLVAAVTAIAWANSPGGDSYFAFFDTPFEFGLGSIEFAHLDHLSIRDVINDALMTIFFFVVGLEIKRELVAGELRDPRAAAMPVLAAAGGMALPAGIFLLSTAGDADALRGWGVPVATDIAFAVGVISLVGRKVPIAAKLFLLALAIVDDIGGILIIAIFYTEDLAGTWLALGLLGLVTMHVMKRTDVRSMLLYTAVGAFVWVCVLESGVHATLVGVALGLMTPTKPFYDPRLFPRRARKLVDRVDAYLPDEDSDPDHHTLERMESLMHDLRRLSRESIPPLERLERALAPWSSFVVVPLFALANAGVRISGDVVSGASSDPILLGVVFGLVVGKVVGVTGAAWIAVRTGIGRMPTGTTWRHLIGVGLLAGIGFTVALFIAALAYSGPALSSQLDSAKIGIFVASLVAGIAGFLWLRAGPDPGSDEGSGDAHDVDPVRA
ncbi:MAG TPA: Na+/H+ antiporter NhaA [Nitriliruptorales bacterium]